MAPRKGNLSVFLQTYRRELEALIKRGDAREESFYPLLKTLLEKAARRLGHEVEITVQPRAVKGSLPDFRIWRKVVRSSAKPKGGQIIGYLEAKRPGSDLSRIEESEQLRRYRRLFPNLLLTDFYRFWLYRDGERVDEASLEDPRSCLELFKRFFTFALPAVGDARRLAEMLATRTRLLRDVVLGQLHEDKGNTELKGFFEAFEKHLIAHLSQEDFADLFAQTITYGLFAARIRTSGAFDRKTAWGQIPKTLGILRELFSYISLAQLPPELEWVIDEIAAVLAATDVYALLDEYYRKHRGEDPIVHFYETFLAVYDPKERERRGVYYTPEPVVDFIVRSLHHLLREKFSLNRGLASREVTLLDPAAGTMTFIARAVELAVEAFTESYGSGLREAFIRDHILKNFYAFELLVAPYSIGHLKMGFYLEELGYRLGEEERVQLLLTNTLDMSELEQSRLPILSALSEESRQAGRVKKEQPILVILGNPPYSGHSANQGEWIRKKIEDYKRIDGKPLREKNPKWLQDDYVKFLRWAEWKIAESGRGVVGMITNHAYLDNPTFRGMRWHLLQTFDEIYILDLHGNTKKRERVPEEVQKALGIDEKDENVFDIRQGVAIAFFVKYGDQREKRVFHADLWGRRTFKYRWLREHGFGTTEWREIEPQPCFYLFKPQSSSDQTALYLSAPSIREIFPLGSIGIVTARDHLTIRWTPEEIWQVVEDFVKLNSETARQKYQLGRDVQDWQVEEAQKRLEAKRSLKGKPCAHPLSTF